MWKFQLNIILTFLAKLNRFNKVQTNVHKGGGKNPSWNQTLGINVSTDTITMTVFDEDPGDDDIIGYGAIDVNTILASGTYQGWIRINYQGKESGEVYIVASVDGSTATYASAMPTYAPAPTVYAPAPTVYAPAPAAYAYAPAPTAPVYSTYAPAPVYGAAYTTMPVAAPAPAMYVSTSPGVYTTVPAFIILYTLSIFKFIFKNSKTKIN